jgi:AcrR family transcriptional regulator
MTGPGPGAERGPLIAAFVELVAERGYENVELSEASKRAGLPDGTAERHFGDRLECFVACWDVLERGYVRRLQRAYEPYVDWRERLRAAALETARLLGAYPKQAHFLAVDALSVGEAGRVRQQALAARLAVFLDEAREDLSDPGSAPAATSGWVIGLFFDRIYRYVSTGREDQFHRDLGELMFLAVSSYFGPEEGLAELRGFPS